MECEVRTGLYHADMGEICNLFVVTGGQDMPLAFVVFLIIYFLVHSFDLYKAILVLTEDVKFLSEE